MGFPVAVFSTFIGKRLSSLIENGFHDSAELMVCFLFHLFDSLLNILL